MRGRLEQHRVDAGAGEGDDAVTAVDRDDRVEPAQVDDDSGAIETMLAAAGDGASSEGPCPVPAVDAPSSAAKGPGGIGIRRLTGVSPPPLLTRLALLVSLPSSWEARLTHAPSAAMALPRARLEDWERS